jgi:hypothetical protein
VTIPVRPGQLYLIDTSARARGDDPAVRNVIAGLIAERRRALYVTPAGQRGHRRAGA